MMKKLDTYAAIAKEMETIMKETFGGRYSNDILSAYAFSLSDEKNLDALIESHGIKVSTDGYAIPDKNTIRQIALSEIDKQMAVKAPAEIETQRIMSRISSQVANVENDISQYSEERIPELYDQIIDKLSQVQALYSVNKEALGIDEDRYRDVVDSIEAIKVQLSELSKAPELSPYEQEEKEGGLLQELKRVSPVFKAEQSRDEVDIDEI